ncbi:hypothetical protein CEXT_423641 [Caerostris extrusa]|uniref:Uncharacterized protein n=1 Tax=Caerostris extrusa TaxID=172846 RepID=A0AAV4SWX8_CAEEX|nr:hypothetical protein CEXT_423641 [Caerostris extrusa]
MLMGPFQCPPPPLYKRAPFATKRELETIDSRREKVQGISENAESPRTSGGSFLVEFRFLIKEAPLFFNAPPDTSKVSDAGESFVT